MQRFSPAAGYFWQPCCPSSKLLLVPKLFWSAPPKFWQAGLITLLLLFDLSFKFTCPSRKLRTEFTSPITKSTSPRLSDMLQKMQFGTQSSSFLVSIWEKKQNCSPTSNTYFIQVDHCVCSFSWSQIMAF